MTSPTPHIDKLKQVTSFTMLHPLAWILCTLALAALSLARAVDVETAAEVAAAHPDSPRQDKQLTNAPRSFRPSANRPRGKPADRVYVTPCIKKCINKTYGRSGCSAADDWHCLCRYVCFPP